MPNMTNILTSAADTATSLATAVAADSEPAGGAAIGEAVGATIGALVLTGLMLALLIPLRSGRPSLLGRAAAFTERKAGVPGWVALPSAISSVALLVALIGMYWDISLHIDNGRDAGPLANPAHYLILAGLFGVLFAGLVAVCLPREKPSDVAVRIAPGWYAPLGGVLMVGCGVFSLAGFPLDDFWHRLFGQDVTLWGPTHLMLIGGASLSTIAAWVLFVEGTARRGPSVTKAPFVKFRQAGLAGALLVGLSTFQAEFDFGVPQFRLLFHPVLIMLAAGIALVLARVRIGRGGALLAALAYIVIRGVVSVLVGPVWGQTTPHLPLYLAEALAVELVALKVATDRPIRFGAIAGTAIGTLGLAAEWGWSHLWMPVEWPAALLPEAAILGFVAAVAAGALGGAMGRSLSNEIAKPVVRAERWGLALAAAVVVGVIAYTLPVTEGSPVTARVTVEETKPAPDREVVATATLDPPDAAEDAEWFTVTAWQGGGSRLVRMRETGPGTYRTDGPIPVHGTWKSILRLHKGDAIVGVPVFMPEDSAIPAPEVPASATFTRPFALDTENLQRERKDGVAGWITLAGYLTVLAIATAMMAALAIALARLGGARTGRRRRDRRSPVATA